MKRQTLSHQLWAEFVGTAIPITFGDGVGMTRYANKRAPRARSVRGEGAAYAAGLATDVWANLEDLRENWGADKTWEPEMESVRRCALYDDWKRAVIRSFDWVEEPK